MLAPLALLLALPLVTAGSPQVKDSASIPPAFFPHGTAAGTWTAGDFMQDGVLTALLLDAAGNPVFALDAHLAGNGQIYGELHSVVAAAAPTLQPLLVVGQAQMPVADGGRFKAKIFSPLEGPLPIQPYGEIDGVLLLRERRSTAIVCGLQPASAPAAELESDLALRPYVILCPAGRGASLGGANGLGYTDPMGGRAIRPIVVGPPQVPGVTLVGQTQLGAHALATATPVVPELPALGQGTLRARWYLLP